jgi:hypothetical protein
LLYVIKNIVIKIVAMSLTKSRIAPAQDKKTAPGGAVSWLGDAATGYQ